MTEPINQLEAELSGMQPFPMPDDLAGCIETELQASENRVSPWPDRFLLAAMGSGALAACVLMAVLLAGFAGSDRSPSPSRIVTLAPYGAQSSATPLAFARNNPDWVDVLK